MRNALWLFYLMFFSASVIAQTDIYTNLKTKYDYYFSKNSHDSALVIARMLNAHLLEYKEDTSLNYALSMRNIGECFSPLKMLDSAIYYHQKCIKLMEKYNLKNTYDYAYNFYLLGVVYFRFSDFYNSEKYQLKYNELIQKIDNVNDEALLRSNLSLGLLYRYTGNLQWAIYYYEKELDILNSLAQKGAFDQIKNYDKYYLSYEDLKLNRIGAIADISQEIGDYAKADSLYRLCFKIVSNRQNYDTAKIASVKSNLGIVNFKIGNYEVSENNFKDALNLYNAFSDNSNLVYGNYNSLLNNLGNLYLEMKDYQKSEFYLKLVIQRSEKYLSKYYNLPSSPASIKDSLSYATYLNNLAVNFFKNNQIDSAEYYLNKVLKIKKKMPGLYHPSFDRNLYWLTNVNISKNNLMLAKAYCKEAVDNTYRIYGKNSDKYAEVLKQYAFINFKLMDYDSSYENIKTAFNIKKDFIRNNFSWLSEKEKATFLKKEKSFFENLFNASFSLHDKIPETTDLAFDCSLITKSLLLESYLDLENAIYQKNDSTLKDLYYELKKLKSSIIALQSSSNKNTSLINNFTAVADSLERRMVKQVKEYTLKSKIFEYTWKDVQNALAENEAAIEYTSFFNEKDSQKYYVALVIRKGFKNPKLVKLASENETMELISKSSFGELYKSLWEPSDSLLDGVNTIYYSPIGYLNNLSFAALCSNGSKKTLPSNDLKRGGIYKQKTRYIDCEYLSERYTLHQLSTTRYLAEGLKSSKIENNSLLVFGGVNYDSIPTAADSLAEIKNFEVDATADNVMRNSITAKRMEYLPGTKTESENLQKILRNKKWKVKAYSDVNASENIFKSELNSQTSSVLHIATHGFAFPEPEEKKKSFFEEDKRTYLDSDNPMTRCGLFFAGANNSWLGNSDTMYANTGEDGILSALEVSQLNLRKSKLVVLSACETGLGKIEGSEGTFGLKRGFKMAGVEQIIVSLWSVPDVETMELMTIFYNDLSVTLNPVISFEKAQKEMRRKYPEEPEKWAGFVLVR